MNKVKTKTAIVCMLALAFCVVATVLLFANGTTSVLQQKINELTGSDCNENSFVVTCDYSKALKIAEAAGGTLDMDEGDSAGTVYLGEISAVEAITYDAVSPYLEYIYPDLLLRADSDDYVSDTGYTDENIETLDKQLFNHIGLSDGTTNIIRDETKGSTSSHKSIVVVIDSGVNYDHEEFLDENGNTRISSRSYNASTKQSVATYGYDVIDDTYGHGTLVCGTIFASADNGKGIAGIAPDVELIMIKVTVSSSGSFSNADVLNALTYAADLGADVVNLSLGAYSDTSLTTFTSYTSTLVNNGTVVVAAAGNTHTSRLHYPSADSYVISVGAFEDLSEKNVGDEYGLATYSSYGIDNVDVVAPGTLTSCGSLKSSSLAKDDVYSTYSGTSFACPVVSAAVALYRSLNPDESVNNVKVKLLNSATDYGEKGRDYIYGYGGLNVWNFVYGTKSTVTFHYKYGYSNVTQSISCIEEVPLKVYPTATNVSTGYFDGWYLDEDCTISVDYYRTCFEDGTDVYGKYSTTPTAKTFIYTYDADGNAVIKGYYGKSTSIEIPSQINGVDVVAIAAQAFKGTSAKRIYLPSTVTTIGEYAFSQNSNVEYIGIPSSVVNMNSYVFANTTGNIYFESSEEEISSLSTYLDNWNTARPYISGTDTSKLNPQPTADFIYNTSVLICDDVTYFVHDDGSVVYAELFDYSGSAYSFVADTVTYTSVKQQSTATANVTAISAGAFEDNETLRYAEFPYVTTIGESAFEGAKSLLSVSVPSIAEIGSNAFYQCLALQYFNCGDNVALKTIGSSAFAYTSELTAFDFGTNITEIGDLAFAYSGIKSVDLGNAQSLVSIGKSAFADNESLTAAALPTSANSGLNIGSGVFAGTSLISLHVPFVGENADSANIVGYYFGTQKVDGQQLVVPSTLCMFVCEAELADSATENLTIQNAYSGSNFFVVELYNESGRYLGCYATAGTVTEETLKSVIADSQNLSGFDTDGDGTIDNVPTSVSADCRWTAYFDLPKYTITFVNEDGTAISSAEYTYGQYVKVPQSPEKQSDKTYTYSFADWQTESGASANALAVADATYYAVYNKEYKTYTVSFTYYFNGSEQTASAEYHYGDLIDIPEPQDIYADGDLVWKQAFVSWEPQNGSTELTSTVSGNAQYKATYALTKIVYTIAFYYDSLSGTCFAQQEYNYGDTIVAPSTERASTAIYSYAFVGWTEEFQTVTQNTAYVATYEPTYRSYQIVFQNDDGTELSNTTLQYGNVITSPEQPTKAEYTFVGWFEQSSGEQYNNGDTVTGAATYVARFRNTYTIIFLGMDGSLISKKVYAYGEQITVPDAPELAETEANYYEFSGWSSSVGTADRDMTITAQYNVYNYYSVTFADADGVELAELKQTKLKQGDKITAPADLTKQNDAQYTYAFDGWYNGETKWNFDSDSIDSSVTLRARFTQTVNTYNVTVVFEGADLQSKTLVLSYGSVVEFSQFAIDGYTYSVYSGDSAVKSFTVTGDSQLRVVYTKQQTEIDEPTEPTDPVEPTSDDSSNTLTIVLISVGSAAVVGAGVAVVLIILKKRKNIK